MNWRSLGVSLVLILGGAVIFSLWPVAAPQRRPEPPPPRVEPEPPAPRPSGAPPPAPLAAPAPPPARPAPPPEEPEGPPTLDPEPDPYHLAALGLGPEELEPLDGGVLHPLSREGIKAAVTGELPEIRECYQAWRRQNPTSSGRLKLQLTILEIPGRARGKVQKVEIAGGGLGQLAMEGCVRDAFQALRFEAPPNGELRVSYPLPFEPAPK